MRAAFGTKCSNTKSLARSLNCANCGNTLMMPIETVASGTSANRVAYESAAAESKQRSSLKRCQSRFKNARACVTSARALEA